MLFRSKPKALKKSSNNPALGTSDAPFEIYNLGNSKEIDLEKYISLIEKSTKKKSFKKYLSMQPGDVKSTKAEMTKFFRDYEKFKYTNIEQGIEKFVLWYKKYNNI